MQGRPTLRDVADAAGVHTATASRALNPQTRGLVSPGTARKVLRAAESLGYQPNPIARSLKTAKSRTIGLVIPDLTNPMFPPMVRGIEDVLAPAGYSTLIVNTDDQAEREQAQVTSLRARSPEGLIVATALREHPLLHRLSAEKIPLVLVNRRADGIDVPTVAPDDTLGIDLAVRHLVDLGHRRIVHLAGPQHTSTGVDRLHAFRAAMREHGLGDDRIVVCERWTEDAGAAGLRDALDSGPGFTAVVAGNDLLALGCYDVCAERGIACPEALSVTGFNGMPFLDKLRPPLTTVAVPHHDIGREAARMLLDVIENPAGPVRTVRFPPTLIVRGSTAASAAGTREQPL